MGIAIEYSDLFRTLEPESLDRDHKTIKSAESASVIPGRVVEAGRRGHRYAAVLEYVESGANHRASRVSDGLGDLWRAIPESIGGFTLEDRTHEGGVVGERNLACPQRHDIVERDRKPLVQPGPDHMDRLSRARRERLILVDGLLWTVKYWYRFHNPLSNPLNSLGSTMSADFANISLRTASTAFSLCLTSLAFERRFFSCNLIFATTT